MMNKLIIWVQIVKHNVSIAWMTSSKHYYLKVLRKCFQKFYCMRSNVDSCLNFLTSWKFDINFNIMRQIHTVIAMNQSFIKIKYNRLFFWVNLWFTWCNRLSRKFNSTSFCLLLWRNSSGFKSSNVLSRHRNMLAG